MRGSRFNIMMYDCAGPWTAYGQLNMGTPFYGYHYTNISQLFGLCPNAAYTSDGACDNTVLTVFYGPD